MLKVFVSFIISTASANINTHFERYLSGETKLTDNALEYIFYTWTRLYESNIMDKSVEDRLTKIMKDLKFWKNYYLLIGTQKGDKYIEFDNKILLNKILEIIKN